MAKRFEHVDMADGPDRQVTREVEVGGGPDPTMNKNLIGRHPSNSQALEELADANKTISPTAPLRNAGHKSGKTTQLKKKSDEVDEVGKQINEHVHRVSPTGLALGEPVRKSVKEELTSEPDLDPDSLESD